jgi:hypothetical protein
MINKAKAINYNNENDLAVDEQEIDFVDVAVDNIMLHEAEYGATIEDKLLAKAYLSLPETSGVTSAAARLDLIRDGANHVKTLAKATNTIKLRLKKKIDKDDPSLAKLELTEYNDSSALASGYETPIAVTAERLRKVTKKKLRFEDSTPTVLANDDENEEMKASGPPPPRLNKKRSRRDQSVPDLRKVVAPDGSLVIKNQNFDNLQDIAIASIKEALDDIKKSTVSDSVVVNLRHLGRLGKLAGIEKRFSNDVNTLTHRAVRAINYKPSLDITLDKEAALEKLLPVVVQRMRDEWAIRHFDMQRPTLDDGAT